VVVETPTGGLKTRVNVVGVSGEPYLTFDHGDIVAVCQHIDAHPYGEPAKAAARGGMVSEEEYKRHVAADMPLTPQGSSELLGLTRGWPQKLEREAKIRAGLSAMSGGMKHINAAHVRQAVRGMRQEGLVV
jgi:hypothetical protein